MSNSFVIKGDICYSRNINELNAAQSAYLVCENGLSKGVFSILPEEYANLPLQDFSGCLVVPGLSDLHVHAPQYSFRALGMDLELLDWLNAHTFPEESRYSDLAYAKKAYSLFVDDLKRGPNTRACIFATIHTGATALLMDLLEAAGLVSLVGKVNMDRNCCAELEESTEQSAIDTKNWIESTRRKYKNTAPILTPRFIPACTDSLMHKIKGLQAEYGLPVQSHLSENPGEIAWVKELCPESKSYGNAYRHFGLFGGEVKTVMAHCVWSDEEESALLQKNGVFVAHCPQSNTNLSSGIAPVRRFLNMGISVGLGSDVAGGAHTSIFRAMSDAIQCSKLRWRLIDQNDAPLTIPEAFYLGTVGSGAFFGKVGSFDYGYEFDAVVIDDANLATPRELSLEERLTRVIYLSDDRNVSAKFVRGNKVI